MEKDIHGKSLNSEEKILDKFINKLNLNILPKELSISTMTIICHFDTCFLLENIASYIELNPNETEIISVQFGDLQKNNRKLETDLIKKKKKRKPKRKFYNQVTTQIFTKNPDKIVNGKLFKNGSVQITGCKSVHNFVTTINTLCKKLCEEVHIIDFKKKVCEKKSFTTDISNTSIDKLASFRIVMINSNFDIGYKIDREELFSITKNNSITATYEPIKHACVNIKYKYDADKIISIFVFESGKVIITGSTKCDHILKAYAFITSLLNKYKDQIVLQNIDDFINHPDIMNLL
jgi:TATA-box binding protein (TBP) (component of TFIID and TFIIIB)